MTKFSVILGLLLISFTPNISFGDLVRTIKGVDGLKTIKVPLGENSTDKFELNYAVIEPERASGGNPISLVLLGGGPSANLEANMIAGRGGFPKDVRIIVVEYRGFGVNTPVNTEPFLENAFKDFSSVSMAKDLVQVLRKEGVKDYILYGQSFGTVVATKTAVIAEKMGLSKPVAVVLEGAPGGVPSRAQTEDSINYVSKQIQKVLPPQVWDFYKQKNPLGYDGETWRHILGVLFSANGVEFTLQSLNTFWQYETQGNPQQIKDLKEYIEKIILPVGLADTKDDRNLLDKDGREDYNMTVDQKILASEVRLVNFTETFQNGRISIIKEENLLKLMKHSEPYRAADWQIPSPIYYIHGRADLYVPYLSGMQHFESQYLAPQKQFVAVLDGGHAPVNLLTKEVKLALWKAILSGNQVPDGIFGKTQNSFFAKKSQFAYCRKILM